jgi:hypothetical protein
LYYSESITQISHQFQITSSLFCFTISYSVDEWIFEAFSRIVNLIEGWAAGVVRTDEVGLQFASFLIVGAQ